MAPWHNTRDPVRREAFLLKQVKTLELWQGSLVHRGIELYVIPQLQQNTGVDWNQVVQQTITMARRQFVFSAARRYREAGMSKTRAGDDYCALRGHETEEGVSTADFDAVVQVVRRSLTHPLGDDRVVGRNAGAWQVLAGVGSSSSLRYRSHRSTHRPVVLSRIREAHDH